MKLSLIALTSLSLFIASASADKPSPQSILGVVTTPNPASSVTDSSSIAQTAHQVDQTASVDSTSPPSQPIAVTEVTATDGEVSSSAVSSSRRSVAPESWIPRQNKGNVAISSRASSDYYQVFGPAVSGNDASIQGTAYLTYRLVSNSTYNVDDCLAACSQTQGCVFANLYYEFNNPLYDWVFSEKSNLACALYGDIHTAAEKTNQGGQQQKPLPYPVTRIAQSTGWALRTIGTPDVPAGYTYVPGPLDAANRAPAFMGFSFISTYSVQTCADLCNSRPADPDFGSCQAFNIWRAVVNGFPTTYTCSFYALPLDASTADDRGQGDLKVTYSRMYNLKNLLVNGGFEGNANLDWSVGGSFTGLSTNSANSAHSGEGYAYNGDTSSTFGGSITSLHPIRTVPNKVYTISFWYMNYDRPNKFSVHWNGVPVGSDIIDGPDVGAWTQLTYTSPPASGNDVLSFHGGNRPAYWYIDDVSVSLA